MADTDKLVESIQQLVEILKGKSGTGKSSAIAAGKTAEEQIQAEAKAFENLNTLINATNEGKEKQAKLDEGRLGLLNKYKSILEEALKTEIEAGKINGEAAQKYIADLKTINGELEKEKNNLTEINKKTKEVKNSLISMGKEAVTTGLNLRNAFSPQAIIEAVKKFDELDASVAKATGAGRRFTQQLADNQRSLSKLGISLADMGNSYSVAATNLFLFNSRGEAFQKNITGQAAKLEKLGISQQQFYKNVNTMNSTLGLTSKQSVKVQKDLIVLANALNMSTTEVNNNLTSNLNRLSIYGKDAGNQFQRMQIFARSANVEFSTLTDLTEKLTTFEEVGKFAGRANARAGFDLFDPQKLLTLEGADKGKYMEERLKLANIDLDDPKQMRSWAESVQLDPGFLASIVRMRSDNNEMIEKGLRQESTISIDKRVRDASTVVGRKTAVEEGKQTEIFGGKKGLDMYVGANDMLTDAIGGLNKNILFLGGTIITLAASISGGSILKGFSKLGDVAKGTFSKVSPSSNPSVPLKSAQLELPGMTPPTTPSSPVPPSGAVPTSGGGFFSNIGGKIAGFGKNLKSGIMNPKQLLQNAIKGTPKDLFKKALGPVISILLETVFANQAIKGMINSGMKPDELEQAVGKRALEGIGGVGGALLGGTIGAALLGPIGTLVFSMLGDVAGRTLAGFIGDSVGAKPIGKTVLDLFYKDEVKASATPKVASSASSEENLDVLDVQDAASSPGRPVIKTAAGQLLRGTSKDTAMLMDFSAMRGVGNNNMDMAALQAIANRPVVIQIDGKEIARVAHKEFTPRYAG
jgi:hypothetical protein